MLISPPPLATSLAYSFGGYMVSIATAALTVAILMFGEITPKNYATLNAEKNHPALHSLFLVFYDDHDSIYFYYQYGVTCIHEIASCGSDAVLIKAMTEEELRTIVDVSHEDGVIESDEKKMIYNVFDLGDADAKDIMVPRVNVSFADVDSTYDELIDIFRRIVYASSCL